MREEKRKTCRVEENESTPNRHNFISAKHPYAEYASTKRHDWEPLKRADAWGLGVASSFKRIHHMDLRNTDHRSLRTCKCHAPIASAHWVGGLALLTKLLSTEGWLRCPPPLVPRCLS